MQYYSSIDFLKFKITLYIKRLPYFKVEQYSFKKNKFVKIAVVYLEDLHGSNYNQIKSSLLRKLKLKLPAGSSIIWEIK